MAGIVMFTPVTEFRRQSAFSACVLPGTGVVFVWLRLGWAILTGGTPGTAMETPSGVTLVVEGTPVTRVRIRAVPAVQNVRTGPTLKFWDVNYSILRCIHHPVRDDDFFRV